jgi:hypothetical protein
LLLRHHVTRDLDVFAALVLTAIIALSGLLRLWS